MYGAEKIQEMMETIRREVPKQIAGLKVTEFRDYREDVLIDCISGTKTTTGLPESNVLYFELEDSGWCCIRPSGTEPKIKFYVGVRGTDANDAAQKLKVLTEALSKLAE